MVLSKNACSAREVIVFIINCYFYQLLSNSEWRRHGGSDEYRRAMTIQLRMPLPAAVKVHGVVSLTVSGLLEVTTFPPTAQAA
jgi:hypothetical protein